MDMCKSYRLVLMRCRKLRLGNLVDWTARLLTMIELKRMMCGISPVKGGWKGYELPTIPEQSVQDGHQAVDRVSNEICVQPHRSDVH